MIAIDNVLLSDQIVDEAFVCDLDKCKGGCCVDGDCGAPLNEEETFIIAGIYPKIRHHLVPAYAQMMDEQGTHTYDTQHGLVTPSVDGGICAYGYTDEKGIVKCGIEKAWLAGEITFRKPISCHLFPIRIFSSEGYDFANYEPRKPMCRPACKLGKKLSVPVYQFLKEPLIRKYGADFYEALHQTALHLKEQKGDTES